MGWFEPAFVCGDAVLGTLQAQSGQVEGLLLQRRGAGEQVAGLGPTGTVSGAGRSGCAGRRPCAAPPGRVSPVPPPRRSRLGRLAGRRRTAGARACGAGAMRQGRRAGAASRGRTCARGGSGGWTEPGERRPGNCGRCASTRLSRWAVRTASAAARSLPGRLGRRTGRPSSRASGALRSRLRRKAQPSAEISRSQCWTIL